MRTVSSVVLQVFALLVAGWLLASHPATLQQLYYWKSGGELSPLQ